jgi:hypothetical protein
MLLDPDPHSYYKSESGSKTAKSMLFHADPDLDPKQAQNVHLLPGQFSDETYCLLSSNLIIGALKVGGKEKQ